MSNCDKSHPSFFSANGGEKMVGLDHGRCHWRIGSSLSGSVNNRFDFSHRLRLRHSFRQQRAQLKRFSPLFPF
jgi:hypothetical protein